MLSYVLGNGSQPSSLLSNINITWKFNRNANAKPYHRPTYWIRTSGVWPSNMYEHVFWVVLVNNSILPTHDNPL
jgi:hypothetical protein